MERIAYTPAQEQGTWQYKAVLATRGNQTLLGSIVLHLIGKVPKHPPHIDGTASVDEDGLTYTLMTNRHGVTGIVCIGLIQDIRDEFRRLSDYLKLDDGERVEFFDELRKWIAVDLRAEHDELKRHS